MAALTETATRPPLKILFVAHAVTYYGASRSLRGLISGYDGITADNALPRFLNAPDDAFIHNFFGPRIRNIHRFFLPSSRCYLGAPKVWQAGRGALLPLAWRAQQRS